MKIALVPINPVVGDVEANAEQIADAVRRLPACALAVFPELCVAGYPPRDLLMQAGFISACQRAVERLAERLSGGPATIIGAPLTHPGGGPAITNSLVLLRDGRIDNRYDKRLLPTYDVFDEQRYFIAGKAPTVIEHAGRRIGLSICEDLWGGIDANATHRYTDQPDPIADTASLGVDVIISPSASPFVAGKDSTHHDIVRTHAQRHRVPILSINQHGANDDLIFDGEAIAIDSSGARLALSPRWSGEPVVVDLDAPPVPQQAGQTTGLSGDHTNRDLIEAITIGVRDYARKSGFESACLGLSGGIDSAVTAAIAARAIGAGNVLGVAMPGKYSSDHSITDAHDLAARLGCRCFDAPIAEPFDGFRERLDILFADLGERTLGRNMPDITEENLQSRVRGTLMMAVSNRTGALLLTTGNKSELAVGYGTLYGDMNGGLAVISDLLKQEVYAVARALNDHHAQFGFDRPPIPESTITKPPSAELAPGQTDQDSLPPYDVLDEIVRRRVELRQSQDEIEAATGSDRETIDRMCRLIAINEYKRFQLAIGLKLKSVAFGPGRRMPLAARSGV